jgi:hypothetical protein
MERHPVYVIHPWGHSEEEWEKNTESVSRYMRILWEQGYNPVYAPFFNSKVEATWEEYIAADLLLIDKIGRAVFCGTVLSPGCEIELDHCAKNDIPVLLYMAFVNGEEE